MWWFRVQHILESELEGLEEVRGPRPRHELGSTISAGRREQSERSPGPCPPPLSPWEGPSPCRLEGSGGPESSSCVDSFRKTKGQRAAGRSAPCCSSHGVLWEKRQVSREVSVPALGTTPCPCTYKEGRTASLSSPSHRTMSCHSDHFLAPGLRWLARTSPPLET